MKPTLLIMAAGVGSRYGGLKQLDTFGPSGETLIDYSVFDAMRAGFGKIVFVIRKEIEKEFKAFYGERYSGKIPVDYVMQEIDAIPAGYSYNSQRTKPWGTGQAILLAAGIINEPFSVINADDFYGREAFAEMGNYLSSLDDNSHNGFAMVGYKLSETLSEFGGVSRGKCNVDGQSRLKGVTEIIGIERRPEGGIAYKDKDGQWIPLAGDSIVSMNTWGFTPRIFDFLERDFKIFLNQNADNPKAEFYIPSVVNHLLETGEAHVNVLLSNDRWFGVTYHEDKAWVSTEIRKLIAKGIYPEKLFA
jgi:dTDP-glucose pyrophosphorylase